MLPRYRSASTLAPRQLGVRSLLLPTIRIGSRKLGIHPVSPIDQAIVHGAGSVGHLLSQIGRFANVVGKVIGFDMVIFKECATPPMGQADVAIGGCTAGMVMGVVLEQRVAVEVAFLC